MTTDAAVPGPVPVRMPVLMYHSVTDEPTARTAGLSVTPAALERQLRHLRDEGYRTWTFGALAKALDAGEPLPDRTAVLTFDDGYADTAEQAAPLLQRYGCTATVFVSTGWVADAGGRAAGDPLDRTMRWSQVRELADAGVEVGAHSHSHPELDQLRPGRLRQELADSRALLEDELQRPVTTMAYPFGRESRGVRSTARAVGYTSAAAVGNVALPPSPDLLAVPRLTVRRSTDQAEFERLVRGEGLLRSFWRDRLLTEGYKGVRRTRSALRRLRGGDQAR